MSVVLPEGVTAVLDTLAKNGYDAYIVGGCVRDGLLGAAPQDWDIASSAPPARVKALFPRTIDTGVKHGTVTVALGRSRYEVTTFRLDGAYLDNRRPESVSYSDNIRDDLSRRDFTMNAIAYNPSAGYVDPFGGRGDIERRVIRCVGEAALRFGEDALRMMRAVRFASQLNFRIARETLDAIAPLSQNLRYVSAERIRAELTGILSGATPEAALLLRETGLLTHALMGREYRGGLEAALNSIRRCPKHTPMLYALFLSWAGGGVRDILRDLRFDNKTIRETCVYVKWLELPLSDGRYEVKKYLNELGPALFDNVLTLKGVYSDNAGERQALEAVRRTAGDIIAANECFTLNSLAVNGNVLAEAGVGQGRRAGELLAALLDAVMREPDLNDKNKLLEWISRINL